MSKTPAQRAKEWRDKRWIEIEAMPKKLCACGCGTMIAPISRLFQSIQYVHGHNPNTSYGLL